MDIPELNARFTYHAPKEGQPEKYTRLRETAKDFAMKILEWVPESREQSLAITAIEEAIFWANAGIARRS